MIEFLRLVLVAIVAAVLSALYFMPVSDTPTPIATVHPAIEGAAKEDIKPPKVVVFEPGAKKKLPVPDKVKDDKNEHVLAATTCVADDRKHTVTTVINETTGESVTYDHRESLPWLARKTKHAMRIDYGYKLSGAITRVSYRADLLQIKALHFGVNSSIDSDGTYFIGGGAELRF